MPCFGLFSRLRRSQCSSLESHSRPSTASPQTSHPTSSFHAQAQRIAQIPVGGLQRTGGSTASYHTAHQPQARGPYASRVDTFATDSTGDDTLIGSSADILDKKEESYTQYSQGSSNSYQAGGGGAWKGKPNGTPYDRREELTEEDEDMWARMAM